MNEYGTTFQLGKSIEKYMKSLIIDDILSGGRECGRYVLQVPRCRLKFNYNWKAAGTKNNQ